MGADHKAQIDAYNVAVLLVRRQVISQIMPPTSSPKIKQPVGRQKGGLKI